ncbi:MAG: molecular chaperone TorD family protein [Gammaproteobacteria bacterium]
MTVNATVEMNTPPIAPEDQVRASLYALLGTVLLQIPDQTTLDHLSALEGESGDVGSAINTLSQIAKSMTPASVEREYNVLFIGVGRGEVLPYASYYLTGFLHEKPLADLRGKMRELGIQRKQGISEPEDHLGALCEMMAGMITGAFGEPMPLQVQKEFFNAHIAPWAAHCFSDLEKAESAVLYAPVGSLGRLLMGIEQESFRIE